MPSRLPYSWQLQGSWRDGESVLDAHLPPQLDDGVDTASGNHVRRPARRPPEKPSAKLKHRPFVPLTSGQVHLHRDHRWHRSIREFQPNAPVKVVLSAPTTAPSENLHPDVSAMAVLWAAAAHPRASAPMRRPWPFSRRRRLTGRWPF